MNRKYWAKNISKINIKFGDRGINVLVRSGVIFIGIGVGVNDCCYWLFIGLVFALIDGVSC